MEIYLKKLFQLNRNLKIILQIIIDSFIILFCIISALFLRLDQDFSKYLYFFKQAIPLVVITISIFYILNYYKNILRYLSLSFFKNVIIGSFLSALTFFVLSKFFELKLPRSIPIIYFILVVFFISIFRILIVTLYLSIFSNNKKSGVLIFGAGEQGKALALMMHNDLNHKLIAFVDDNKQIQNLYISSVPIISRNASLELIKKNKIHKIFIAISSLEKKMYRNLFEFYYQNGISIKTIPPVSDMISKNFKIDDLKNIELSNLLGRDQVKPKKNLLKSSIFNKNILITGAGGSIGSEICKQIITFKPKKIVVLDSNEYALYKNLNFLSDIIEKKYKNILLIPVLSNLSDKTLIAKILISHNVNIIFHSAAYKHVTFAEQNIIEIFKNNFIFTKNLLDVSIKFNVERFTLISTDKAVNPTSMMGASKRLSEMICQLLAQSKHNTTISIVRFGNVLGSSGSVVPKFQKQIDKGGPIYVTHPKVTRYFMLIEEAAQLVIQASSLSKGGEIFVLDMGERIQILELAKLMIKLSGSIPILHNNKIDNKENSFIRIKFSKLSPGEKLHEELYSTDELYNTSHPLIKYEKPAEFYDKNYANLLSQLEQFIIKNQETKIIKALSNKLINYKKT